MVSLSKAPQIIAVPDGGGECGLIAGWSLRGAMSHAKLSEAWIGAGLSDKYIPEQPSPEASLGRAIKAAHGSGVRLEKLPAGAGWAVVDVSFNSLNLPVYTPRLVARLSEDKNRLSVTSPDGQPDRSTAALLIESAYAEARGALNHSDISAFLCRLVDVCDGVSVLRDGGGVYYIPPAHVAEWRQMIGIIRSASRHFVGEIPAMRSDAAVSTILAGLEAEARAAAEKLQEELEAVIGGDKDAIGQRALAARMKVLEALKGKVRRYADLFQQPAEAALNFVEKVGRNLTATLEFAAAKADGCDTDVPVLLVFDENYTVSNPNEGDDLEAAAKRFALLETDGAVEVEIEAKSDRKPALDTLAPLRILADLGLVIETAIATFSGRGVLDASDAPAQSASLPLDDDDAASKRFAALELD